jgi:hypothetical protein
MDPFIQQLIALGGIPDEHELAKTKFGLGHEMFNAPGAEGMRAGGTYVASSPLEHLAVALQRSMGASRMSGAQQDLRGLVGKATAGRSAYADALMRYFAPPQEGPPALPVSMPQEIKPDEVPPLLARPRW